MKLDIKLIFQIIRYLVPVLIEVIKMIKEYEDNQKTSSGNQK